MCYNILGDGVNKINRFFKHTWKYILIYIIVIALCLVKLPYYIDAPGGLINVSDRIEVEDKQESAGSINLAYVTEYNVNLPMLIISFFIDDWTLNKIETKEEQINYEESFIRDRLLMEEAYTNAIILAYKQADKEINILSSDVYVSYIVAEAQTDLAVGDKIVQVDDILINSKESLNNYVETLNVGDNITIKILNDGKEKIKEATIINYNDNKLIGIVPVEINKFEANPDINIKTEASEYGPSGGLMISLAVYNAITEDDITGGLTIVGTGTIDLDGNVGAIGGIEYKIKGAAKKGADIFRRLGVPGAKVEDWKYTKPRILNADDFVWPETPAAHECSCGCRHHDGEDCCCKQNLPFEAYQIRFENGFWQHEHNHLPEGL